jgi:hypothetical protein
VCGELHKFVAFLTEEKYLYLLDMGIAETVDAE